MARVVVTTIAQIALSEPSLLMRTYRASLPGAWVADPEVNPQFTQAPKRHPGSQHGLPPCPEAQAHALLMAHVVLACCTAFLAHRR